MSASPFSLGTRILGAGALVLTCFLVVGAVLPSEWEAEATARVDGSLEDVFRFLDSPEGWRQWTPWPESGVERTGPDRGEGAALSWSDPELGSGSFTIVRTAPPVRVEYAVEVDGGAMTTAGVVTIDPHEDGGARVVWREHGDLGWNPLMGYWGLSMSRAQTDELVKGLERLAGLVVEGAGPR